MALPNYTQLMKNYRSDKNTWRKLYQTTFVKKQLNHHQSLKIKEIDDKRRSKLQRIHRIKKIIKSQKKIKILEDALMITFPEDIDGYRAILNESRSNIIHE